MNANAIKIFLVAWGWLATAGAFAQQTKASFYDDIRAFHHADSLSFPAHRQILLVGSSSFTFWKDVATYFPKEKILNRGFGGSTLVDLIHYFDDVIRPYHPAHIVIYSGENDFAYQQGLPVDSVVRRFERLFSMIRKMDARVPVSYVSMKPSPSRRHLLASYQAANDAIRKFLQGKPNTAFIDVYHAMIDTRGHMAGDLFRSDSLHLNEKGYALWQKIMSPYLARH